MFSTLLLVTGCSKSEVVTSYEEVAKQDYIKQQPAQQEINNNPVPVVFDVYAGDAATTRAITSLSDLQNSTAGIGIFTYYTQAGTYNASKGFTSDGTYSPSSEPTVPNFMYNEQATWVTSAWSYDPIKYWPNDYTAGDVDNQSPTAEGSKTSRLSFFAYVPWTAVTAQTDASSIEGATTGNSTGIVGFSGNAYAGDPYLIYYQSGAAGDEDLFYAYNDTENKTKPSIGSTITFNFKPALARMNLTVRGIYDETTTSAKHINSNNHDISDYINFIKVESVNIRPYYLNASSEKVWITKKGRLNLNTGAWSLSTGDQTELGVDYNTSTIAINLAYNPDDDKASISLGVGRYYDVDGKTNNAPIPATDTANLDQELIADGNYLYFIPFDDGSTHQLRFKVTIKYHVYTLDARMKDGWSHIVNEVESTDAEDVVITPTPGNSYTLKLLLGMTTVQMRVKDKDSDTDERDWWNKNTEVPSTNPYNVPDNP